MKTTGLINSAGFASINLKASSILSKKIARYTRNFSKNTLNRCLQKIAARFWASPYRDIEKHKGSNIVKIRMQKKTKNKKQKTKKRMERNTFR